MRSKFIRTHGARIRDQHAAVHWCCVRSAVTANIDGLVFCVGLARSIFLVIQIVLEGLKVFEDGLE